MYLVEGEIYHVFNRGNNRGVIFPRRANYYRFLEGMDRYVKKCCDILSWCLMPNHFHLLVHANEKSTPMIQDGSFERQQFSQAIKQLLSSYAKAINKQEDRIGSLFQQKTKCRQVNDPEMNYSLTAFHYIHQNPVTAGIVGQLQDWEFSSFREYLGRGKTELCNQQLAVQLLDIDLDRCYKDSCLAQRWVSYTCQL